MSVTDTDRTDTGDISDLPEKAVGGPGEARQARVVRPYGDTTGDGRVQVSFTLPVPGVRPADLAIAEGAALQLAGKMGLSPAMVVHAKPIGGEFTFFIVYGRVGHVVDLSSVVVAEREYDLLPPAEVNQRIRAALGRELVVVGACVGTDAHTVGIDAILNVKGHAGEKGLEYYREIRVVNLGAQVPVDALVARAVAERADAVLVSQVVTQRDAHLANAREVAAALRAAPEFAASDSAASDSAASGSAAPGSAAPGSAAPGSAAPDSAAPDSAALRRPLLVVGGPRFDPASAAGLGVDKIFGRGTTPGEVASYLVHALASSPPCAPISP